ncbi:MAG TPA: PQQ-binding-like beta-propeller repeat protein [Kofleriaceae bacterium]|nr:PQQ-binding-like beta-propeller repeat protein [Kofleriaceae bacterium]
MIRFATIALVLGACARGPVDPDAVDPMRAVPHDPMGFPALHLRWRVQTADRIAEIKPQEFASPIVDRDTAYVGTATGTFFAVRLNDGHVRWHKPLGAVSAGAALAFPNLYIGTNDGELLCLDAATGAKCNPLGAKAQWPYQSRGPIEQAPVLTADLVVFANEADTVVAVDARTGAFRWQYKSETPDEYTLRGHAGVAVDGDLIYTGFSNGTLVALRASTGSVAWLTSLKGDADRFFDVDATPVIVGQTVFATSSSGGVFALDKATGLVRWHVPLFEGNQPGQPPGNVGGLASDGKTLFVTAADQGVYALDLDGNVLWRQGTRGAGEPAAPVISGDLLFYTLTDGGLFVAEKRTGNVLQYFDPGDGVSASPALTLDDRVIVLTNRGGLYNFDLDRPE